LATVCISALERVDSAARPASFTPLMDSKSPRASQSSGLDAGTRLPTLDMLLAPSEERFRLLVESVKDYGIFMLDLRGTVVSWNQGAERISGYTASDIVGRHFSIFYPPEEIDFGRTARGIGRRW
jgi:PAS domain-containing protein